MAQYVRTRFWSVTEASEVMDIVQEQLKTKPTKESAKEDLCWLHATIKKNPRIEWVTVLKTTPEEFKKCVPRHTFKAYLVRRWERVVDPQRQVWMLYIIPR